MPGPRIPLRKRSEIKVCPKCNQLDRIMPSGICQQCVKHETEEYYRGNYTPDKRRSNEL
jgi:hypothetical protein